MNHLHGTEGCYVSEALVATVHGLTFSVRCGVAWQEIAAGRHTVASALKTLSDRANAAARAELEKFRNLRQWLGKVLDLVEEVGSTDRGTLNRYLRERFGGAVRIQPYIEKGTQLCLYIRDLRYLTSHSRDFPCDTARTLLLFLSALYEEMAAIGMNGTGDFCEMSTKAERQAAKVLQDALAVETAS